MKDEEILFSYRLKQAEETLLDAERMLQGNFTSRSITNRAYYSMFYAVSALFLKTDVNSKTSKHIGVISLFDREFIHTKKIDNCFLVKNEDKQFEVSAKKEVAFDKVGPLSHFAVETVLQVS